MSKRAEDAALKAYPYFPTEVNLFGHKTITADGNSHYRVIFVKGYEQAEKDTIERACEWLEKNIRLPHPRKGTDECIVNLNAFREAMEEGE